MLAISGNIFLRGGEIYVEVEWWGFDERTEEPLENVLNGAHKLLFEKLQELKSKKKISRFVYTEVCREIERYQEGLEAPVVDLNYSSD